MVMPFEGKSNERESSGEEASFEVFLFVFVLGTVAWVLYWALSSIGPALEYLSQFATEKPDAAVAVVGVLAVLALAHLLSMFKRKALRAYGAFEVVIGLTLAFYQIDRLHLMTTEIGLAMAVPVALTSIFLVMRGFENLRAPPKLPHP